MKKIQNHCTLMYSISRPLVDHFSEESLLFKNVHRMFSRGGRGGEKERERVRGGVKGGEGKRERGVE